LFFITLYVGCSYLAVANGLILISNMEIRDYFDQANIFTHVLFVDDEIKNVFNKNSEYVRNFISPYIYKEETGT